MVGDEMVGDRQIARVTWRDTNHIIIDYDNGEVELCPGTHQLAADMAEREGLVSVRAPRGRAEWNRDLS